MNEKKLKRQLKSVINNLQVIIDTTLEEDGTAQEELIQNLLYRIIGHLEFIIDDKEL